VKFFEFPEGFGASEAVAVILVSVLLSGLSGAAINYLKHSGLIASKVLDQYLKVREFLNEELADLAAMSYGMPLNEEDISRKAAILSKAYYQYFDYLPPSVMANLLCLITCLTDKRHRLFGHGNDRIYPLSAKERADLISEIGLFMNFRLHTLNLFKAESPEKKKEAQVAAKVCLARKVLLSIHETFTMYHFMSLVKQLQKPSRISAQDRVSRRRF
jgi:hypothetical protein